MATFLNSIQIDTLIPSPASFWNRVGPAISFTSAAAALPLYYFFHEKKEDTHDHTRCLSLSKKITYGIQLGGCLALISLANALRLGLPSDKSLYSQQIIAPTLAIGGALFPYVNPKGNKMDKFCETQSLSEAMLMGAWHTTTGLLLEGLPFEAIALFSTIEYNGIYLYGHWLDRGKTAQEEKRAYLITPPLVGISAVNLLHAIRLLKGGDAIPPLSPSFATTSFISTGSLIWIYLNHR